jgi:hypothetical protein
MPRSTYTGPPATIADMRRIGVSAVIIECARLYCYHQARIEFDALALPDELYAIDITKHRRFVCTKCGARKGQRMRVGRIAEGQGWGDAGQKREYHAGIGEGLMRAGWG